MFTGIVVECGSVRRARERVGLLELDIEAPKLARSLKVGDSIAVNGVCLTAIQHSRRRFMVQAMDETLTRTTLGSLRKGDRVNLELSLRLHDRLGGHLVQGHIDGVAEVVRVEEDEGIKRVWFATGAHILDYVVPKGSIALDGVSLTVADLGHTTFQVALIPHTLAMTTLGDIAVGDRVNVEVDVVAKYVKRFVEPNARGASPRSEED